MQRVTIVGLGLIGGSIGLGLRKWSAEQAKTGQPVLEVIGFDASLDQQNYAKKMDAVDRTEWDLGKAIKEADLVVVCTPVATMKEVFADIAPFLKAGAVVTDAGSTKANVLEWAKSELPTTVSFVGGHPMAGKALSIEGAEANLFEGATWCVCPLPSAKEEAVRTVLGLVAALGAEPYFIDPHEHDGHVAGISHLPFVLSTALVNAVSKDPAWRDMKTLTAGGFRDMSRLAGGSVAMHRDILLTNREAVARWVARAIEELEAVQATLAKDEEAARADLDTFFTTARDARAEWATQTTREGALLQSTGMDLVREGVGDQMSRMLLGGFARKRKPADKGKSSDTGKPTRK